MNLKKLMFWKSTETDAETPTTDGASASDSAMGNADFAATDNVLPFPGRAEMAFPPVNEALGTSHGAAGKPEAARHKGLLQAPEFQTYFATNYFAFGYQAGARFRTSEALEQGRQEQIARFQNVVSELAQRRRTKIARLNAMGIGVEGASTVAASQVRLTCEHLQAEIAELNAQHGLAQVGQSWVRQALTQYESGFAKGLRTVVLFELEAE
jgi:hypothetical protein